MWGNIKKTTNIFFVLTLQHKRNRKNPCWFYDIIQNTTTVTTNIIVYHSITNFMNNKYVNYITLQQYASDPTNQQKKKKKQSQTYSQQYITFYKVWLLFHSIYFYWMWILINLSLDSFSSYILYACKILIRSIINNYVINWLFKF